MRYLAHGAVLLADPEMHSTIVRGDCDLSGRRQPQVVDIADVPSTPLSTQRADRILNRIATVLGHVGCRASSSRQPHRAPGEGTS